MLRSYLSSQLRPASLLVLLVILLAAALLFLFGDLISIAGYVPLADSDARFWIVAGAVGLFFASTFVRHLIARRANARLISSMLANNELVSLIDTPDDEVELIRDRFEEAMKVLRENPIDGRGSRHYLFDVPWYVIIGPPGTGKTTILRNSGLDFPLAVNGEVALQGIDGTRNCDWWIASDAVFIDTAGRYTTQDVNQGLDADAWSGFLDLLKRYRSRRPVNGVLLAVSIADIALADGAERARQAEMLRLRLRELHRSFKMRLPVYLVFTKCDLIAGFQEYFEDMDEAGRDQVWGVTLPHDERQRTFGHPFETGFIDLVARLERRLQHKLAGERDNASRGRIYSFPHEIGSLSGVLKSFVADIFRHSRYEAQPLLRGVYFTSGTQEGIPFDRLLNDMSGNYMLSTSQRQRSEGRDRTFFIRNLLTDIIFAESNLVGTNKRVERRIAGLHGLGYAAVIVSAIGLAAYWFQGLETALDTTRKVERTSELVRTRLDEAGRSRSLAGVLPVLEAARELRDEAAAPAGWNLAGLLGVDVRPQIGAPAQEAYDRVLQSYLLPALATRLSTQIQLMSSAPQANSQLLRERLETYLMLTRGENYDAARMRERMRVESGAMFPLSPDDRERTIRHTDALAALLPKEGAADQRTIQIARDRLREVPPAVDIYRRMLDDAQRRYQLVPVNIANVLGPGSLRVEATSRGSSSIAGIHTKAGFYDFFLPRLPEYIRGSTGTDWVLGSGIGEEEYSTLAHGVVALYVADYIKSWRGALAQVRLIDFDTLPREQIVLEELSAPQSPLSRLLEEVRDNTELPFPDDAAGQQLAENAVRPLSPKAAAGMTSAASEALERTVIQAALGSAKWPGLAIGEAFRPLNALVDRQAGPVSLANVQQLFGDLYGTVSSIAEAPSPEAAAFDFVSQYARNPAGDGTTRLRAEAAVQPQPVSGIVESIVRRNAAILMRLAYDHANNRWQQEALPACSAILADRYPFTADAIDEVPIQDFSELFKPGGVMGKFFDDYMAPFVKAAGPKYSVVTRYGADMAFSTESLAEFRRAADIRQAFFAGDKTQPEARFTIESTFLSKGALSSRFALDDVEMVYRHGPVRSVDMVWPSKRDASTARLQIASLDGTTNLVEHSGAWAIFRMLQDVGLQRTGGQESYLFSVGAGKEQASFRLRADGLRNPFSAGLYSFRCPAAL